MAYLSPKEAVIQWFEQVWNGRSKEAIPELFAADAVIHLEGGLEIRGPAQFSFYQDQMLAAMPDVQVRILQAVGDDTQACAHWQVTGTHQGEMMGTAATGQVISFTGMSFAIVHDGKIIEGWDCWDQGTVASTLATLAAA